jgi:threonine/homoserine/homoserine lactone efflux protein
MLEFLAVLGLTALISFVGSLQLGAVNSIVIQTTLRQGLKPALWVASGGTLPEIFYAGLAVFAAEWLQGTWFWYLQVALVPFLVGLGLWNCFLAPKNQLKTPTSNSIHLSVGLFAGMLNPQLFPFWVAILLWFNSFNYLKINTLYNQLAFISGAALGAWLILALFAWLAHRHRNWLDNYLKININLIVGLFLIGLGLLQLGNLIWG